jgi:hypothetical protein
MCNLQSQNSTRISGFEMLISRHGWPILPHLGNSYLAGLQIDSCQRSGSKTPTVHAPPNIIHQPLLRKLAVNNSEHLHFSHPQGFASIWNTGRVAGNRIQVACLSSRRKEAIYNQIAFSGNRLDVLPQALKAERSNSQFAIRPSVSSL